MTARKDNKKGPTPARPEAEPIEPTGAEIPATEGRDDEASGASYSGAGTLVAEPLAPATEAAEFVAGYRIVRKLSSTPEGTVYKAQERSSKRSVAVRVIHSSVADASPRLQAMQRDLETLKHMSHTGLAQVLDGGVTEDGQLYLVTDFVRGTALREHAQSRRLTTNDWITVFKKVCAAVHYLHQHCVIHRDLRPANIFIEGDGSPRIVGIGVAGITENDLVRPTSPVPWITPYRSPEQRCGKRARIDVRTDIYALGVMLFEVLTGRLPEGTEGGESTGTVVETPLPFRREISADLEAIARKAMDPEPNARYQTVLDFADDLDNYVHSRPVKARPAGTGYRAAKFVSRCRLGVIAATIAFAAVIAGAAKLYSDHRQRAQVAINEEKRKSAETIGSLLAVMQRSEQEAGQRDEALNREQGTLRQAEMMISDLQKQVDDARTSQATLNERVGRAEGDTRLARLAAKTLAAAFRPIPGTRGNRMPTAVEMLDRAVPDARKRLAEQPGVLATTLSYFGQAYSNLGLPRKAAELLQESVDSRLQAGTDSEENIVDTLNDLVAAYYAAEDYRNVEPACRKLVDVASRKYGADAATTLLAVNNLALALQKQKNLSESEEMFRRAYEGRKRTLGVEHQKTAQSLAGLAQVLIDQSKASQAETILREHLNVTLSKRPQGDWLTAQLAGHLGACLTTLKRFDEAEPLLRESEAALRTAFGPDHAETKAAIRRLSALYRAWGKHEKAEEWNDKRYDTPSWATSTEESR